MEDGILILQADSRLVKEYWNSQAEMVYKETLCTHVLTELGTNPCARK